MHLHVYSMHLLIQHCDAQWNFFRRITPWSTFCHSWYLWRLKIPIRPAKVPKSYDFWKPFLLVIIKILFPPHPFPLNPQQFWKANGIIAHLSFSTSAWHNTRRQGLLLRGKGSERHLSPRSGHGFDPKELLQQTMPMQPLQASQRKDHRAPELISHP